MGFRESLDLSGFIDRYTEFLDPKEAVQYVEEGTVVERDPACEPIPAHLYETRLPGMGEEPEVVGTGPLRASTSRALALAGPAFAWDPNRYYRSLGISWPYVDATRRDLTRGFVERGGQDDAWLMFCLKQLLNPGVHADYDATPLGKEYLDLYVAERKKREAQDKADRLNAEDGGSRTWGDIMEADEEGDYIRLTPEEEAEMERLRALDAAASNGQDGSAVGGPWQYAFYLWRTTTYDRDVLAEWQQALIREAAQGVPTLAVGLMGNQPHRFLIAEVDGQSVVFLNRDQTVTPDLVTAAATALTHDTR